MLVSVEDRPGLFLEVAMRSWILFAAWLPMLMATPALAEQPVIHLAAEEAPPILERIGTPPGLTTLTIAAGGARAAAALAMDPESRQAMILLYSLDSEGPHELRVNGLVRDLLFAPDELSVLGLLHKPAKKREGDTYLVRIELDKPRLRRLARMPPSARALDFWPARNSVLVASRNEIRTMPLPELRSGPLYRVPGENLAVASLGTGSTILVGQANGLVLIDLDDPPGEEAMPVRESLTAPLPVVSLAAAADGTRALARLEDGSVYTVALQPLRIEEAGTSAVVVATERGPAQPVPPADPAPPPPIEPVVVARNTPTAEHVPAPVAEPVPTPAAVPPPTPAADTSPAPVAATIPPAVATTEETAQVDPPATAEPAPAAPRERRQIQGRIVGPAASQVVAVVLLGPDNILNEATRVRPDADGHWTAEGLAPGRYRVQLDGGGERVLVSRPPFLVVVIEAGESSDAPEIRVDEAL